MGTIGSGVQIPIHRCKNGAEIPIPRKARGSLPSVPKNFRKNIFFSKNSKNSKHVFGIVSTSGRGGGQFWVGGRENFDKNCQISVFSPYFRIKIDENMAKKPILGKVTRT